MEWQTTFWNDFQIADAFGKTAVLDTYKRAFEEWKNNTVYITELVIVLNLRCWHHYEECNMELSMVYADLYYKCRDWCVDNLKGNDFKYFFDMTD